MLRYESLRKRPRLIRSLTGLEAQAFAILCQRFEPRWQQAELRRLSRPDRRHAIGGGRPYTLGSAANKLLLALSLLRHGLTYELAGALFGLDTSNARRLFLRLIPVLEQAADPHLANYLQQARAQRESGAKVGTWEALLERCPDLAEVAVDSTEQPCRRPTGKRQRRRYYSGKKKRHTLKVNLVVSHRGRVLHVSHTYPGPTHDTTVYRGERMGDLIPPESRQFLDRGYQGLARDHPEHDIRLPHKRKSPGCRGKGRRGAELTRGQKQANSLRAKRRVVVEHRLAAIKSNRLIAETWRSRPQRHNPVFRAAAALSNYKLDLAAAA